MDLSYVAGFFDGEGSIGIYGGDTHFGRRYHLRTQLTQVDSPATASLLGSLKAEFGGNICWQSTSSGRGKLNWQLNGSKAATFLSEIAHLLVLKRTQARVAIAWQAGRPALRRDERGRVKRFTSDEQAECEAVVALLAKLKRADVDLVMTDQVDIVEFQRTLHRVLSKKSA